MTARSVKQAAQMAVTHPTSRSFLRRPRDSIGNLRLGTRQPGHHHALAGVHSSWAKGDSCAARASLCGGSYSNALACPYQDKDQGPECTQLHGLESMAANAPRTHPIAATARMASPDVHRRQITQCACLHNHRHLGTP